MLVKELKELLKDADDNLTVMFSNDGTFHVPSFEESGVSTFGEPCDENGTPLEVEYNEDDMTFFLIVSKEAVE